MCADGNKTRKFSNLFIFMKHEGNTKKKVKRKKTKP